jgi:hypothetical protein
MYQKSHLIGFFSTRERERLNTESRESGAPGSTQPILSNPWLQMCTTLPQFGIPFLIYYFPSPDKFLLQDQKFQTQDSWHFDALCYTEMCFSVSLLIYHRTLVASHTNYIIWRNVEIFKKIKFNEQFFWGGESRIFREFIFWHENFKINKLIWWTFVEAALVLWNIQRGCCWVGLSIRCAKKNVMANEIVGWNGLKLFI